MILLLALLTITPDTSGILHLSTFGGFGSACPVSPTRAITARHVVDPAPLNPSAPLVSGQWSNDAGDEGLFEPFKVSPFGDIAFLKGIFKKWYHIGPRPSPGEKLWVVGFDWRKKKQMFASRTWEVEVIRTQAGEIIFDRATDKGSSGSCVLNAAGEVVGILEFSMPPDNASSPSDLVGGAVGLWLIPQPEEEPAKEPSKEESN